MQNISESQKVQRTAKFIMAGFYEMDFMKGIVRLVEADDIYKVLKSPLTNFFLVERWNFMIKVFAGVQCLHVYYVPVLLRGRLYLLVTIFYYFSFIKFRLSK